MKFSNDLEKKTFSKLAEQLPSLIEKKCHGYDELYGYKLLPGEHYKETIAHALIYKFCKAYKFQYEEAASTLCDTLNWRREFDPLSAAFSERHDEILNSVGILTSYPKDEANKKVVTWNLYGALVQHKEVFQDVNKFLRYRIGLMERSIALLDFDDETNNSVAQVHDYDGVSMWKTDKHIKQCTKQVIAVFQKHYPELLSVKLFINVPSLLTWVYDVVKKFVSEETRQKFIVLNDGTKLGEYMHSAPSKLYGGNSKETLEAQNVKEVRPTDYTLYLFEKKVSADVE
ncbi:LANO_0G04918g1_1 [Lachancea nothofagi CBS 11611]|uniref:Phosphatidylinositol transfer protein SFH5 n=1 Tax=Lachancea nothofagi CBS 11611 TaxID=1266666 RepID=A0A1G4KG55_9SACH|nr:LANO_0G04918g1_1 [Lachancea nothofagi CBS 11611]